MNKVIFLSLAVAASAIMTLNACGHRDDERDEQDYYGAPAPGPGAPADAAACSPGGNPQGGNPQAGYSQGGGSRGSNPGYNPNVAANGVLKDGDTVECNGQYQPVNPTKNINPDQYQKKYVYCLPGAEVGSTNFCEGQYKDVRQNVLVNCEK